MVINQCHQPLNNHKINNDLLVNIFNTNIIDIKLLVFFSVIPTYLKSKKKNSTKKKFNEESERIPAPKTQTQSNQTHIIKIVCTIHEERVV